MSMSNFPRFAIPEYCDDESVTEFLTDLQGYSRSCQIDEILTKLERTERAHHTLMQAQDVLSRMFDSFDGMDQLSRAIIKLRHQASILQQVEAMLNPLLVGE